MRASQAPGLGGTPPRRHAVAAAVKASAVASSAACRSPRRRDRPATTVRLSEGERLLTDGPFAETKEHLLGFYLVEAGSLDVALDWAAKMPIMRYGTVEVRPVREGMQWQTALE